MDNECIVNSIKVLCKNNNISASQLEKTIGLSQGLISKWQKTMPSLDKIIDIADYFHVSLDEVIGRSLSVNDRFLDAVYDKTNSGVLTWDKIKSYDTHIKIPTISNKYSKEVYEEISYYASFETSRLIIHCVSLYHRSLDPKELNFYIQPTLTSSLVRQDYLSEKLVPLWALILSKSDDAPDDAKAENIKQKIMMPGMVERVRRIGTYYNNIEDNNTHD